MRLFVAAELPAAVRATLASEAPDDDDWRALRPDSLHVTLAFLGELADPEPVTTALRGQVFTSVIRARLGEPLLLPARRPRVCAVQVESDALVELQRAVSGALESAGLLEPGSRPFLPHVTVARARRGSRPARPHVTVETLRFEIGSYALFRSAQNSRYTALFRSTLAA